MPPLYPWYPCRFNLGSAKARVFKDLDEKTPPNFRRFFQSTLYDRMLQTCLLYFNTMFQTEWIIRTMERSRKQHLEGAHHVGATFRGDFCVACSGKGTLGRARAVGHGKALTQAAPSGALHVAAA